ncbi:MAG: hypothetical protein WB573_11820, partial [Terracidiphilus sp.]
MKAALRRAERGRRAARIQLVRTEDEIWAQGSEEERHEGSGVVSVGGILLAELGTHPLFLHAELDP